MKAERRCWFSDSQCIKHRPPLNSKGQPSLAPSLEDNIPWKCRISNATVEVHNNHSDEHSFMLIEERKLS